jgi:small subunit ribosomal protein S25e
MQKWSKGKTAEKLNNAIMWDQATYDKLLKDIPTAKLITPSVVSDRLRVSVALAKQGLRHLEAKGLIRCIVRHAQQSVYTRIVSDKAVDEVPEKKGGAGAAEKGEKKKAAPKKKEEKEEEKDE